MSRSSRSLAKTCRRMTTSSTCSDFMVPSSGSWTGSELPFFIGQSTRPAPVSKSGAGCHAISLRYNQRVLGLLMARYSPERHRGRWCRCDREVWHPAAPCRNYRPTLRPRGWRPLACTPVGVPPVVAGRSNLRRSGRLNPVSADTRRRQGGPAATPVPGHRQACLEVTNMVTVAAWVRTAD